MAQPRNSSVFESTPESTAITWLRRLAALGLYFTASILLLALSPLLLPTAVLFDLLSRRRWACCRTLLFLAVYLCLEATGVLASFWLWLRACALPRPYQPRFLDDNFRLQCWWASALRRHAFRIFDIDVHIDGIEHCSGSPVLLFIRHCSVADTMLPTLLLCAPHGIVLRWVMKFELLWDPCVDIVGRRLQNCFVRRDVRFHDEDRQRVAALVDDLHRGEGVAIYPEGTRFSAEKRDRILAKLHEQGDEEAYRRTAALKSVLPPRLGGSLALLERNRNADALFCTHTGLEASASLGSLLNGKLIGAQVRIALWRVPFAEIPQTRRARIEWLWKHWQRVDAFVHREQQSGRSR